MFSFIFLLLTLANAKANPDFSALSLPDVQMARPTSQNSLKIYFDCFLKTTVSCQDLELALLKADPMTESVRENKADVRIEIREEAAPPNEEQYKFRFEDPTGSVTPFRLGGPQLLLLESLSPQAKVMILTKHLVRGLSVLHEIFDYKSDPQGKLVVTYSPKAGVTNPDPVKKDTSWYIQGNAGTNVNAQGSEMISVWGLGKAGYDTAAWFSEVGFGAQYTYLSVDNGDGTRSTADNLSMGGMSQTAVSVAKHWSVMVLARLGHNPNSNFEARAQTHVGIEYELIPFLESNDNSFSISYIIGGNYEKYVASNINDHDHEWLATHALSVYYVKHINKIVDLSAAAGVTSLVNDPSKFGVGGNAKTTFYVTKAMSVDLSGQMGYKRNIINSPKDAAALNPLLSVFQGSGSVSPVTYQLMLNVRYVWGAAQFRQKDMRWQFSAVDLPVNF